MHVHRHRQCSLEKQMTSKYGTLLSGRPAFYHWCSPSWARECLSSWLSSQNERNRSLAFVPGT